MGHTTRRHVATLSVAAAVTAALVVHAPAGAAEADTPTTFEPMLALGALHTDNFNRQASGGLDETVLGVIAGARYLRETTQSQLELDVSANGIKYTEGRAADELRAQLQANYQIAIVPDRFSLTVSDRYGQIAPQAYGDLRPENRENVNVFSIGPRYTQLLGQTTQLQLAAVGSRSDYESSDAGGNRLAVQGGVEHLLDERRTLSGNVQHTRTTFRDLPGSPSIEGKQAFLRYTTFARRSQLALQAGYSEVANEQSTGSGATFSAALSMGLGARTTFRLDATHGFRDPLTAFQADNSVQAGAQGFGADRNVLATQDYARSTQLGAGLQYAGDRTTFSIGTNFGRERFLSATDANRRVFGGNVGITRELSPRTRLSLRGSTQSDRDSAGLNDIDASSLALQLDYQATSRIDIAAAVEAYAVDREGTRANERRIRIDLTYRLDRAAGREAEGGEVGVAARSLLPGDLLDRRPGDIR
ncbi:MAG: hypothetical protein RL026_1835 [Pseudomonadota bacterium]